MGVYGESDFARPAGLVYRIVRISGPEPSYWLRNAGGESTEDRLRIASLPGEGEGKPGVGVGGPGPQSSKSKKEQNLRCQGSSFGRTSRASASRVATCGL